MTQRFGNPDTVERLGGEVVLHLLGVEFNVPNATILRADGSEAISCDVLRRTGPCGVFGSEASRDLDLATADGDAGDGTAVVAGEMASRTAYATADVENRAGRVERGYFEKEVDEVGLACFFGVGWCEEVGVVDVLAPTRYQEWVRMNAGEGGTR